MLDPNIYLKGAEKSPIEEGDSICPFMLNDQFGEMDGLNANSTALLLFCDHQKSPGLHRYLTELAKRQENLKKHNLVFVTIMWFKTNLELAQKYKLDFPILDDECSSRTVHMTYTGDIFGTRQAFLIENGKVARKIVAENDDIPQFFDAIEAAYNQ